MRKSVLFAFISLTGALLNIIANIIFAGFVGLPLFLDTIFTIAVTLYCGLVWGVLCGALSNIINGIVWFNGWGGFLFALCSIATAFITWLFMRLFPGELNPAGTEQKILPFFYKSNKMNRIMDKMIVLILLSFALCLVISVLGGFTAALLLSIPDSHSPGAMISPGFSKTMFSQNFPVILTEIFSRIPINIIDRLISVFAGYGIAFGMRSLFRFSSQRP